MADRRLDVLEVRWYERQEGSPDIVGRWLAAAEAHLPEAVPQRFGDSEPLRGRRGRDDLAAAYARADNLFFLAGTPPVHHGSLAAGRPRFSGPTWAHSMTVELPPDDDRVRRFALALTHPGMLYLSASVARGATLSRRTVYGPAEQPAEPYLAGLGDWLGLPPEPPAWGWLGPDYARMVRVPTMERVQGGLLYTGGPWVPEPFQARLTEVDPAQRHARRLPRATRRSLWAILRRTP